jgi:hypothetical protein
VGHGLWRADAQARSQKVICLAGGQPFSSEKEAPCLDELTRNKINFNHYHNAFEHRVPALMPRQKNAAQNP